MIQKKMNRTDDMFDADLDFGLSVCDSRDKPFHCNCCGDTYEACRHWTIMDLLLEDYDV